MTVRDGLHIRGGIGDPPSLEPVRTAVSRAVKRDQLDAEPVQNGGSRVRPQTAAWRSMQEEHGLAVGIAVHLGG
jgi:hypothetical protein